MNKKGKRRNQDELDRLSIEVAKLVLVEGLRPGEVLTCLQESGVRNVRDVDRLLQRARDPDRPLISIIAQPPDFHVKVNTSLSDSIQDKFSLREATVVEVNPQDKLKDINPGDYIHELLGICAARKLHSFLRDGDIIGTAGGRGVGYSVLGLEHIKSYHGMEQLPHAKIISLSGVSTVEYSLKIPEWIKRDKINLNPDSMSISLDANSVAQKLASVIGVPPANVKQTILSLFRQKEDIEYVKKYAPYLVTKENDPRPSIAIFGIGILTANSKLARETLYHHIIGNEINQLSNEVWPSCDSPIAQIGYNFFLSNTDYVPEELHNKVNKIAEMLTKKTVSINLNWLNQSHEKILIAGGPDKNTAIKGLLTGKAGTDFKPTWIITDDETARTLL